MVSRHAGEREADRQRDDCEPENAIASVAQFAEVQGHSEADNGPQAAAEGCNGLQDLQHRTDQEPESGQEHVADT